MLTLHNAIIQIQNFVQLCNENNIYFTEVILFGSVISNNINEDSDIDILVASLQFSFNQWENIKLIASIKKKYWNLDVHTFPTDYYTKGDPFINEIKKTGIRIDN